MVVGYLASVWAAVSINTSYVRTTYWFENGIDDEGNQMGSTDVDQDERPWLFDPAQTDDTLWDHRDADRVSHEQTNWLAIIVSAGLIQRVLPTLTDKYLNAGLEEPEEDTEEAEEDVAEEAF